MCGAREERQFFLGKERMSKDVQGLIKIFFAHHVKTIKYSKTWKSLVTLSVFPIWSCVLYFVLLIVDKGFYILDILHIRFSCTILLVLIIAGAWLCLFIECNATGAKRFLYNPRFNVLSIFRPPLLLQMFPSKILLLIFPGKKEKATT